MSLSQWRTWWLTMHEPEDKLRIVNQDVLRTFLPVITYLEKDYHQLQQI